ncbi:MAG: hypothetical protein OXG03_01670 [Gammaproteobacteria bacterium]|nr:hypothetical protein [Gammaproteobacteria bacterium]
MSWFPPLERVGGLDLANSIGTDRAAARWLHAALPSTGRAGGEKKSPATANWGLTFDADAAGTIAAEPPSRRS